MPFHLSSAQLANAHILIDCFSPDAFGLARYLAQHGARHVRIVDAGPLPAELHGQAEALRALGVTLAAQTDPETLTADCDLIFADLFLQPLRPFIRAARARGVPVTTHADLILQLSPLPVIGVTGSAGKSSSTLLVFEALRAAGQQVCLGRDSIMENLWPNYEILAQLDELHPPGWLVLELTSSHLEYMHASPNIAVVTVLWPDHVDWHGGLDRYFAAKRVILDHQAADDWAILNADDERQRATFAPAARGPLAWFSHTQAVTPGVFVRGDQIMARWVWGDDTSGRVADWGYSTTTRMNFIVFALAPGGGWGWSENFRPSYPADEGYYVLQGELTVHNPETGEVEVVRAGEALHFRQNTWHFGYNFTLTETLVVEAWAPVPPGVSVEALERLAPPLTTVRWARAELLGRWPAEAGEVRTTRTLFPMRPDNWLHTLSGGRSRRRVSLFVATEHLVMGRFDVLPGQVCDPEVHSGEEVLLSLAGRLQVLMPETGERFELAPRDAIYLPPGVSHRYVNGAGELAQALFAVAPGIGKAHDSG